MFERGDLATRGYKSVARSLLDQDEKRYQQKKRRKMTTLSKKTIGYIVQLGGIAAFVVGAVLSAHHAAIAASFAGGAAAFYVGEKIRTLA